MIDVPPESLVVFVVEPAQFGFENGVSRREILSRKATISSGSSFSNEEWRIGGASP